MRQTDHGARTFAFFDVDDTLLELKTMFSFQDYYLRHTGVAPFMVRWARAARFQARFRRMRRQGVACKDINRLYYQSFRGRRPEVVSELARQWFAVASRDLEDLYVPETLAALREHQSAGVEVVLVSGSMMEILRPIADALGVHHIIATRVVVAHDRYTGEITPPQTIGKDKRQAVENFLLEHGADGRTCWAYGDDISDTPMLSLVGHPVVVSRDSVMVDAARKRGWSLLFSDGDKPPLP